MPEQKRINLSFNLNDERDKQVYDFLMQNKKLKTSFVVKAITETFLSKHTNNFVEKEQKFDEKVLFKIFSSEIEKIFERIDSLSEKIDNGLIISNTDSTVEKTPINQTDESKPEDIDISSVDISDIEFLCGFGG